MDAGADRTRHGLEGVLRRLDVIGEDGLYLESRDGALIHQRGHTATLTGIRHFNLINVTAAGTTRNPDSCRDRQKTYAEKRPSLRSREGLGRFLPGVSGPARLLSHTFIVQLLKSDPTILGWRLACWAARGARHGLNHP